jgi:hypothetical protein
MPENEKKENYQDTPTLQILKQIRDGVIDGKKLDQEIRQDCVQHLWYVEGRSVAEIAQILNVSDKTIRRDQDQIRKRNANKPSADYTIEVFGELLQKAKSAHENMMRLSRSPEASVQEKAQAGFYAWKMIQQQIEIAQSLGVAPSSALKIEANIHREEETSPSKLKEELARLEGIVSAKGVIDPKIAELIETVNGQIALAEAKLGIKELKSRIENIDKGQGKS